jgi:hypothetical protein
VEENKAPHFAEDPHPRTLYPMLISNNELDDVRFDKLHPFGGEKIMICADALVQYVYTEPLLYEIHAYCTDPRQCPAVVQSRSSVVFSSYL